MVSEVQLLLTTEQSIIVPQGSELLSSYMIGEQLYIRILNGKRPNSSEIWHLLIVHTGETWPRNIVSSVYYGTHTFDNLVPTVQFPYKTRTIHLFKVKYND